MGRYSHTTKWYIVANIIAAAIGLLFFSGLMGIVWVADVTKISFLILGLFVLASVKCGFDIHTFEKDGDVHKQEVELGWFVAETLLALGMTGTVIGFIIIMKDFMFIDVQDVSSIETLIKSLGSGISTALYTTLFGLVTNTLLKVQYFLLEDAMEKKGDSEDEEV